MTGQMTLGPKDHARLARILQQARDLETSWPSADRNTTQNLGADWRYLKLKHQIAACLDAESGSLKRLASTAAHFHDQTSLAHFYGCLVPFERLAGRALRDDEFLVAEGDRPLISIQRVPLKLIAENLRSSFNVGALFRTAECLGIAEILLSGYTPGPDDAKTARTAMGTAEQVPWRRVDRGLTACTELREQGYRIIALETVEGAIALDKVEFKNEPVAFILGNERFGIETETLQAADAICRIPLRGIKNSLNVGIAFGIAAFEWVRQTEANRG